MKRIIFVVVIIAILISFYFWHPFFNENEETLYDWRVEIKNRIAQVSVIYLSYNILHDSQMISELEKQMEEKPTGHHSVKSFYAKYGISLTFSYREFSVTSLYKPCTDANQINSIIVASLAKEQPTNFNYLYNDGDILVFVVQTNIQGGSSGGCEAVIDAFGGSSTLLFTTTGYFSGIVAHEIAHSFGAKDHYAQVGGINLGCKNCLMNTMGNDEGVLNEATIFCSTALEDEIHWDWVCKRSRESYDEEWKEW